ncbi:MAG TPA: GAF domain-containing protein, partial [Candidatus Methylomirabilis sp.]|nr:GAF domain-containing protein [Candidatus Methylomirabilis sp.]
MSRLERAASPAPREVDAGDAAPDPDPRALGIIHELLSIPSAGLDPGELFALAMDRASRLLSADRAMLFVAERGGERLTPRSAHGFRREDLESTAIRPGEGLVGRVFKERRVLAYTIGDDAEAPDAFIERFPVSDAIAVPVRAEDDVTGVLYVGRRRLGAPFTANDVLLLLVIADRVGGGLVHQALLDRRTRHVARLDALRALAGSLRAGRPLAEFLAEACEAGRRLVDVRAAAVALEVSSGELEIATARGLPVTSEATGRLRPGQGLTADLYAGADLLSYRDAQSGATVDRSFLGDGGFHGCLLLPLMSRGSVAGVLYLADTEVRDFSTEEIAAARVLAALVASAIEGSRSAEALHTSHTAAVSERD